MAQRLYSQVLFKRFIHYEMGHYAPQIDIIMYQSRVMNSCARDFDDIYCPLDMLRLTLLLSAYYMPEARECSLWYASIVSRVHSKDWLILRYRCCHALIISVYQPISSGRVLSFMALTLHVSFTDDIWWDIGYPLMEQASGVIIYNNVSFLCYSNYE